MRQLISIQWGRVMVIQMGCGLKLSEELSNRVIHRAWLRIPPGE